MMGHIFLTYFGYDHGSLNVYRNYSYSYLMCDLRCSLPRSAIMSKIGSSGKKKIMIKIKD